MRKENEKQALKVSKNSIIANVFLTGFKMWAGVMARSGAMISDAVHSASDVLSTIVVIVGVKIAGKAPDQDHPYGHERMECVAAILLAGLLCATGVGIGYTGVLKIWSGNGKVLVIPGVLALVAAVVSIVVKEGMYWYTIITAKKIKSSALKADAWHHRSDALSSVGSFIGIMGARMGFPVLDPVASVVICFFIIKAAWDIFMDAIGKMTDKACDVKTVTTIQEIALKQPGVKGIDRLKTRLFGDRIYVDIEVRADEELTLRASHEIAQNVHDAIENGLEEVKHCMVHMHPETQEMETVN